MNLPVLASTADHGTRSISHAFVSSLSPARVMFMPKGFKRSGWRALLEGIRFIREADKEGHPVLCLFNAPVLIAAIAPRKKGSKRIGILDWTEAYPSGKSGWKIWIYNRIYVWAFRRLDVVASPVPGFRAYYNRYGANIQECLYPLPKMGHDFRTCTSDSSFVRLLYIGADYKRKGGDVLLEIWRNDRPPCLELTFVCPHPPFDSMEGVRFLTDIKAGSEEHRKLFSEHDLFVLPTRQEPFGYVLLEAVSSGLAVVTTRVAGAAGLVREAGGFVENSPEEAVRKAFEICRSREALPSISKAATLFCMSYNEKFSKGVESLLDAAKRKQSCLQVAKA
jgi:glycosyltransferase involved in cell wall biosynthesis